MQVRGRFAKGYVWSAAAGVISAGRPAKLVVANAPVTVVRGAKAWSFTGEPNTDNISFASVPGITYPWTYLIRLRRRSAQDDARIHSPTTGSDEAVISLSVAGSGLLEILDAGYAWESLGSLSSILPVGEYRTVIITLDASKVAQAYSQGIAYGNTSISAGTYLNLGGGAYVGGRYTIYGAACEFDVTEVGLLSGALSDAEAKALSGNLYGELFVPHRRVLYFATVGGAVTINATPADATAAGVAAQVLVGTLIQATPGNVTAEGVTATVQVGSHAIIAASPALGEALGVTAQILVGTLVNAVPADAVAAGVAAQVLAAVLVQATPGEAIAEGVDALVSIPGETTLTAADLDAIWAYEIETGITALQALRILLAAVGGKRVGLGTATEQYMAQDGTTPRITFSPTDAAGNGTPVVDGS